MSLDLAARAARTGQLLVRSGIEIDRILAGMLEDHSAVSANLPGQIIFLSRLVHIDPLKQRVMLAYSDYKAANAALFKLPEVNFICRYRWAMFGFVCAKPRPANYAGQPVIKVNSPAMVLALQHNKTVVRAQFPKAPPDLRCQLPIGATALEARLVDMSVDGRAFLLGDPALPICAGTWVRGARIIPGGEEVALVDMEIRHVTPMMMPDGERMTRIGCRIIGAGDAMERIVRRFIIDFQ